MVAGCQSSSSAPSSDAGPGTGAGAVTRALFALTEPADADLFAVPYPNDLRRRPDGTVDLAQLSRGQPVMLQRYLDLVTKGSSGGFSPSGATYFRFTDSIDPKTLPQSPEESLAPGASIAYVCIDKRSVDYGKRIPVRWKLAEGAGKYVGPHALSILPVTGFILEPGTRYAVLLTDALLDVRGKPVQPDRDFRALLADAVSAPIPVAAHQTYQPLREYLKEKGVTGVVSAAVFTTSNPTEAVRRAREVVYRQEPPQGEALGLAAVTTNYLEVQGTYRAPHFQHGQVPFLFLGDGGELRFDADGAPTVARTETLRFSLTVPRGPMPAGGWPVVLYAHGTGGSYRSFIKDQTAERLARVTGPDGEVIARLAVISIDQNLHGPRAPEGTSPELTLVNLQNPVASIFNLAQGGIDDFSLLRLVERLRFASLPWVGAPGAPPPENFDYEVRFDSERIYFMGHSQGGLTGAIFLAHEPRVRGAVLSGAGGGSVLSILHKTQPTSMLPLVGQILREPVDAFHPVLNLLQTALEPGDPNNYGPLLLRRPRPEVGPKHLFLSEGFVDHYTPNETTESLAVAAGAPHVGGVVRSVPGLALRGLPSAQLPVAGNLTVAGRQVTAGLLQYATTPTGPACQNDDGCPEKSYCNAGTCHRDGHYVLFDQSTAARQVATFFATMVRDGVPTLVR